MLTKDIIKTNTVSKYYIDTVNSNQLTLTSDRGQSLFCLFFKLPVMCTYLHVSINSNIYFVRAILILPVEINMYISTCFH